MIQNSENFLTSLMFYYLVNFIFKVNYAIADNCVVLLLFAALHITFVSEYPFIILYKKMSLNYLESSLANRRNRRAPRTLDRKYKRHALINNRNIEIYFTDHFEAALATSI